MCGPVEAQLALAVVGAVVQNRQQKADADALHDATVQRNNQLAANANIAYASDMGHNDMELGMAAREKSKEDLKNKMAVVNKQAEAINKGFGNPTSIMRHISGEGDLAFNEIQEGFEMDNIRSLQADQQNYRENITKTYNSMSYAKKGQNNYMGLALDIAGAGASYASNENRKFFKQDSKVGTKS